jgi:hypothetical protein
MIQARVLRGVVGLLRSDLLIELEELAAPTLTHLLAPWCNWLTRRPLKAESSGSIPDGATRPHLKTSQSVYILNKITNLQSATSSGVY